MNVPHLTSLHSLPLPPPSSFPSPSRLSSYPPTSDKHQKHRKGASGSGGTRTSASGAGASTAAAQHGKQSLKIKLPDVGTAGSVGAAADAVGARPPKKKRPKEEDEDLVYEDTSAVTDGEYDHEDQYRLRRRANVLYHAALPRPSFWCQRSRRFQYFQPTSGWRSPNDTSSSSSSSSDDDDHDNDNDDSGAAGWSFGASRGHTRSSRVPFFRGFCRRRIGSLPCLLAAPRAARRWGRPRRRSSDGAVTER